MIVELRFRCAQFFRAFNCVNLKSMAGLMFRGGLEVSKTESSEHRLLNPEVKSAQRRKYEYVWRSIIGITVIHIAALYGFWLIVSGQLMLISFIYGDKVKFFCHLKIEKLFIEGYGIATLSGLGK